MSIEVKEIDGVKVKIIDHTKSSGTDFPTPGDTPGEDLSLIEMLGIRSDSKQDRRFTR